MGKEQQQITNDKMWKKKFSSLAAKNFPLQNWQKFYNENTQYNNVLVFYTFQ